MELYIETCVESPCFRTPRGDDPSGVDRSGASLHPGGRLEVYDGLSMSWDRPFDAACPLPEGRLRKTLRDAAGYIRGLLSQT